MKNFGQFTSYFAITAAVCSSAVTVPALAQNAPEAEASDTNDIVVTARRRDESLARVPIAVSVLSGDQLETRSVRTDSDLQTSTPGLTIRQTQGNNSLTYSLRGQSADTFSGSPSAVVTYLNEVPLTISGASTFYDLASVQVLKGPQGTLFGRNATGGAVLYSSAKPTNEYEGQLRVRVGNLDMRELDGMINIPLIDDKLLLRGAFDIYRRDGYIENRYNGEMLGRAKRESGRVSLTIKPTESLSNDTTFQYSRAGGSNTGASYTYSVYGCGETNNGFALTCGAAAMFGPGLDAILGDGAWEAFLAANPKAYAPGLLAYVDEQRRLGHYVTNHPGSAAHRGKDWMLTNTTQYELNSNLTLKNIFGASRSDVVSAQPQLGAPFITISTSNPVSGEVGNELHVRSVSNELQLQGTALDDALNFIVGGYLQRMRTDTIWPQTYFDLSPVLAGNPVTNAFRVRNKTDALYGQATYDLSSAGLEGVRLTAGLRYTWERVSISQLPNATYTFGAPDQHNSFQAPSWEAGIEYQATPQLFAYLKTRGSFRSGGFNGAAQPVDANASEGGNRFASEKTQDIEAGLKFRGNVGGMPATLNLAVYNQWIQNVQRVEFPDPDGPGDIASIAVTANIPSEVVRGFELEGSLQTTDWLQIGGSLAHTDAKFTNGKISLFGNDFIYGPVGDTPKWSGVAYAQIGLPMDDSVGSINLRAEVYAQMGQYFSNAAASIAPRTRLPGYAIVNSRISWDNVMGSPFSAAVFAKNLLDKAYFAGGMTLAAALGHNAAAVAEPRTYGLELSAKF